MFVAHLALNNFRSYESVDLALSPGVSIFLGSNGQGKTNLLEAVGYLATLSSHRVSSDLPLIRQGAGQAQIQAQIQAGLADDRKLLVEVQLNLGKANRASINRSPLRRVRDILGSLRAVVFAPEDLVIVKGDPGDRRRFIDELITSHWPRLAGVRADYEKAVKQRTTLLKSFAGERNSYLGDDTLGVWDEAVARFGAEIIFARLAVLDELDPLLGQAYFEIAPAKADASLSYKSLAEIPAGATTADIEQALLQLMAARRGEELARGLSLVGPHRDDITLNLAGFPAKGYASHGESWSYALALKLGAFQLLRANGLEPVLLLDDVFAELDEDRRMRLANSVLSSEQVLITAAVAADVPRELTGATFKVALSKVEVGK
ncbi:MAG: DNA replication/repair protein RecF [Propionibacteriaceae bacterium]|nr:DNA replication/repair protein RecF [Propionibacteriaceae bacterium]